MAGAENACANVRHWVLCSVLTVKSRLEAGLVLPNNRTTAVSKRLKASSSGLVDLNNFAAFIEAAFRANAMWHARLLAIWTDDSLRRAQRVVGAALAAACF